MRHSSQTRRRRLFAVAFCAAGMCQCSTQFGQLAIAQAGESTEWANESPQEVAVAADASITQSTEPISPTRTPINRSHSPSTERNSSGDARSTSWAWAWLPIVVASALWWLVSRLRSGRSHDHSVLPEGVIVPLGRRAVGGGQSVQLIRIGSRILVVTPTAEGLRTLTEITDPQEVERLVSLCLQPQQGMAGIGGLFSGRPIRPLVDSDKIDHRTTVENSRSSQAARAVSASSARSGQAAEVTR